MSLKLESQNQLWVKIALIPEQLVVFGFGSTKRAEAFILWGTRMHPLLHKYSAEND